MVMAKMIEMEGLGRCGLKGTGKELSCDESFMF